MRGKPSALYSGRILAVSMLGLLGIAVVGCFCWYAGYNCVELLLEN